MDQGQCLLKKSRFEHIILLVQGHKQLVAGAEEEGAHGAQVAGGDPQPGGKLSHLSGDHCSWRTGRHLTSDQSCKNEASILIEF